MAQTFAISYRLTGSGWSECEVTYCHLKVALSASYLSDALGKLVHAGLAVALGFHLVEFGFDEEPGEYRWSIQASGPNSLRVSIVEFQELWSHQATGQGRSMLGATVRPFEYARAVHDAANAVLQEYGLDDYAKRWAEHPFPLAALQLLGGALSRLDDGA